MVCLRSKPSYPPHTLTRAGRKRLAAEQQQYERMHMAIRKVLVNA
jgi:hypothetical protein